MAEPRTIIFVAAAVLVACVSAAADLPVQPNLVLVTVEALRADHLGSAGWPYARTRTLDRMAAAGVRFAACDTASPSTRPSVATILTGRFPPHHGVRDDGDLLADEVPAVAERLAEAGYATAAVVGSSALRRHSGLLRGFGAVSDEVPRGGTWPSPPGVQPAEDVSDRAAELLGELDSPYFLWVHFADVTSRREAGARRQGDAGPTVDYDTAIAGVDEEVGAVIRAARGDTYVIVVGSQGEMLGEHGEHGHGLLPLRGARRVPLLLVGPDLPSGTVEDCLVRTADVAPTLLTLAGARPLDRIDGETLLPLPSHFGSCGRRSFCEAYAPYSAYGWFPLQEVGDYRWTYLQGPDRAALYDARGDDLERHDLSAAERLESGRWLGRLSRAMAGAAVAPLPSRLPDPRLHVAVHAAVEQATRLAQSGACDQALITIRDLVAGSSANAAALALAGSCELRLARPEAALPLLSRAVKLRPRDPGAAADLGACLARLGRSEEAEASLHRALSLDPADGAAAAQLAQLLRARGDLDPALIVLDEAEESGAGDAVLYLERGLVQAARSEPAQALADLLEAADRAPDNPLPLELAAQTATGLARFTEAADLYERLVDLDPERGEVWQTLGSIYLERLHRRPAALRCFRQALRLATDEAQRRSLSDLVDKLSR